MREVFDRCQLQFVAENMHEAWTTPKRSGWSRYDEIHNWMSDHLQPARRVLVLDDDQSGASLRGSALCDRGVVVLCAPWIGFDGDKLYEAQRLLRAQSN